ncbi:hypothetical protein JTE90_020987 [Oedothorax gibbosus]|uniref:Uncharacterized protein n=1 Tax=Oedothorax gibbosus TaxID=931172 RepID=A0AAV6U0N1_9ARAC|nr:hypothetical protein JTE90_020987 [Oedothorax gibbosus]
MSSIHGIRSYLNAYKRTLAASPIYVEKALSSEQSSDASMDNGFYERSSGNKTAKPMTLSKYDFDAKSSLDKYSTKERGSDISRSKRNQAQVGEMKYSPKLNQYVSLMSSTRPRVPPVCLSIFKDGRLEEDIETLSCASSLCSSCKAENLANSVCGTQKASSSFDTMDSYKSKAEAVGQRILANFEMILSSAQPKEPNLPGCDDKASLGSNTGDDLDNCSSDGSLCSQCQASNPDDGVSKENGIDEVSDIELMNNYKAKTEAVGRRIIENFELIMNSIGKSGLNSPRYDSKTADPALDNSSSETSSCSHCQAFNPKSDVSFENCVYGIQKALPSFESPDKVEYPRVNANFQRVISWLQDLNPAEYDDVAVWDMDTHYALDNSSSETSLCSCCQAQGPNHNLNGSREYGVRMASPIFKQISNEHVDAEIVAQRFSPNFQRIQNFTKGRGQKTPDNFVRSRKREEALFNFSSDNSSSQVNRRMLNLRSRPDYGTMLYGQ